MIIESDEFDLDAYDLNNSDVLPNSWQPSTEEYWNSQPENNRMTYIDPDTGAYYISVLSNVGVEFFYQSENLEGNFTEITNDLLSIDSFVSVITPESTVISGVTLIFKEWQSNGLFYSNNRAIEFTVELNQTLFAVYHQEVVGFAQGSLIIEGESTGLSSDDIVGTGEGNLIISGTSEGFKLEQPTVYGTGEGNLLISGTAEGIKYVEPSISGNAVGSILISGVAQGFNSTPVGWVAGGTEPTAEQTCNSLDDLDNVRCATKTQVSCQWVIVSSFVSATNQSTSATCQEDATRIICAPDFDTGQWICYNQEADVEYEYSDCEVCSIV
jgi:hypothetical protein